MNLRDKYKRKQIEVIDWISYLEAIEKYKSSIDTMGGFFDRGMRWNDYVIAFKANFNFSYVNALRESIIKNNIKITGNEHQYNDNGCPLFSDYTIATFSFRAWGDLLAAIWSTEENKDYCYMDFYC